jgi:branched-chain amino acid aminotransferase
VKCIISSFRRGEQAMPAQMKIGGHYFLLSWLRQQARQSGADDAIFVNDRDAIAEATGTAVFALVDGHLVTPPIADGALPSITARIIIRLAAKLGIPNSVRSINRSELFHAKGAFLAGTLDEIRPISSVDGVTIPNALNASPMQELLKAFESVCRGELGNDWGERIDIGT